MKGGLLYWNTEVYVKEGSGNSHLSLNAWLGKMEGVSFTRDFDRK